MCAHDQIAQLLLAQTRRDAEEHGGAVRKQLAGRVKFDQPAFIHHKDPVALDDRVQSMGDGDSRQMRKVCPDDLLHALVGRTIYVGSRLVHDKQRPAPHHRSRKAKQLPLTGAHIATTFLD
eukprot:TRINITY_DN39156_c0_g1_i1.p2 TRINITY_DN39156_c0_g1~~TRINITY_DN39156_c0_g1_i1.p2  ORF type:complete len:121 (-),score=22.38 TRINITY_DN39156_c0_g1_i1:445-807(-)